MNRDKDPNEEIYETEAEILEESEAEPVEERDVIFHRREENQWNGEPPPFFTHYEYRSRGCGCPGCMGCGCLLLIVFFFMLLGRLVL